MTAAILLFTVIGLVMLTNMREHTGRRVTFEYVLLRGVNDSPAAAQELAARLAGLLCHVNLIPFNPVPETGFAPPEAGAVKRFLGELRRRGIPATVRRSRGRDIDAACGQLRRRGME